MSGRAVWDGTEQLMVKSIHRCAADTSLMRNGNETSQRLSGESVGGGVRSLSHSESDRCVST